RIGATTLVTGRYLLFFQGRECGMERWSIEGVPDGYVVRGDQELVAPHPFPNRQEYRATLTREWRVTGLEIRWNVGDRTLVSTHRAGDGMWRVRVEYAGPVKEQEGDFPAFREVDHGTHLFNTVVL